MRSTRLLHLQRRTARILASAQARSHVMTQRAALASVPAAIARFERRAPVMVSARDFHLTRSVAAPTPFILADIGEGIAEVELLQWFVKEGDTVKQFDKLCEVQSDKATVEITSRYAGKITKVHHKAGDVVKVGSALVDIEQAGGAAAAAPKPAAPAASAASSAPAAGARSEEVMPFLLADIGEGIAEVELLQWFVKEGQAVKQFDKVCEVQSDKANVEITSRYDGRIVALHHKVGETVKVGSSLMDIAVASSGASTSAPAKSAAPSAPAAAAGATHAAPLTHARADKVLTTPAVRRIAKENNVDLRMVPGTGPKGRVLKEDILRFIKTGGAVSTPAAAAPAPSATPTPAAVTPLFQAGSGATERVPIRGIQKQMVKSMRAALQIPHFGYKEEVVVDKLVQLREQLKPLAAAQGVKLSYLPIIVKATSMALKKYPVLNSSISPDETELIYHADHNIGVAMDTARGLLVPNIKAVQNKSVFEIAAEINALQELGKKSGFSEAHLTGGTFTLSNIGSIGGTYANPVIMTPQVAIGALGKFQVLPRFVDANGDALDAASYDSSAAVKAVRIMNVSWSGDHRVIDGATIARFSNLWKQYLENPASMISEMK